MSGLRCPAQCPHVAELERERQRGDHSEHDGDHPPRGAWNGGVSGATGKSLADSVPGPREVAAPAVSGAYQHDRWRGHRPGVLYG